MLYIWTNSPPWTSELASAEKKKTLCLPDVLSVTLHKVIGGCWDCVDSQKNILTFLELQQVEQMAFSPVPHHSLSFPSSCPIVHFSYLTVSLGRIQHLLKSMENLLLNLFGFGSCFLWSFLPLAMTEPKSPLWPLNGSVSVSASPLFSLHALLQESQQSNDGENCVEQTHLGSVAGKKTCENFSVWITLKHFL